MRMKKFHLVALVLVSGSLWSGQLSLAKDTEDKAAEEEVSHAPRQATPVATTSVSEIEEVSPEPPVDKSQKKLLESVAYNVDDQKEAIKLFSSVWAEGAPVIGNTEIHGRLVRLKELYSKSQNAGDKARLAEVLRLLDVKNLSGEESCTKEHFDQIVAMFRRIPKSRVNLFKYLHQVLIDHTKECLAVIVHGILAEMTEAQKSMLLRLINANNIDKRRNGRTQEEIGDEELYYEGMFEYLDNETGGKIRIMAKEDSNKFEKEIENRIKNMCEHVSNVFELVGETYSENEVLCASKLTPADKIWIAGYRICRMTLTIYDDLVDELEERFVSGKGRSLKTAFRLRMMRGMLKKLMKSRSFQNPPSAS